MIREIINFTKFVDTDLKEIINENISPQQEGLYIVFSEDGYVYEYYKDGNSISSLLKECTERLRFSWTIEYDKKPYYQKCFDLPNKRIHSVSPFMVAVKRKYLKGGSEYTSKEVNEEYIQKYLDKSISETILDNDEKVLAGNFKECISKNYEKIMNNLNELKPEDYVLLFYKTETENYKKTYSNYLKTKIFNSSKLGFSDLEGNPLNEKQVLEKTEFRGWSNFYNGYNAGKPFLQHLTSTAKTNTISNKDAYWLFVFNEYCRLDVLPNPILPIFVDESELQKDGLQSEIIKIYNKQKKEKPTFREIVKELLSRPNKTLQKYYLLYRDRNKICDFDFVPLFRYKFNSTLYIENSTESGFFNDGVFEKYTTLRIDNIFDFESIVVREIFNNSLIKKQEENYNAYYFDDLDPKYVSGGDIMWQLIMKYRKAFYDYIYKSKINAITATMFDDIMLSSILSNIQHEEINTRCEYNNAIKKKINIWFSIYNLFSKNKKEEVMASNVTDLISKMKAVTKGDSNIETPEEFAFGAGQLASYLIDRSVASNKTYAMLEPYLQKGKSGQLQDALAQTIAVYKHDIGVFSKGNFEMLSAQVLTYDAGADMKPLLKYFLAGCFSPCAVYAKKED
ncbi:MAG: hypothetical protein K6G31_06135 [Paludibacteraceae bacterium]|nr:hypothetical protein [Paludibacteraceae bacterium]